MVRQVGMHAHLQDASGCTALMQLIQAGKLSDARALLSKGDCNVNAVMTSTPGHSALMMVTMGLAAGAEVDGGLVEDLLAQGASPDLQVGRFIISIGKRALLLLGSKGVTRPAGLPPCHTWLV